MENNLKLHLKLYYNFGGSTSWLKDEIIKKRYDSFRYFMPVEKKSEANTVVEIYSLNSEDKKNKYIDIIYTKKVVGFVNVQTNICKDLKLSVNECNNIYTYLKKTYFERT